MMAPFVRVCCRPRTCPNSWAATWRRSMPAGWKDGGAHLVQTKSEDSFVCFDLLARWGFCYLSPSSAKAPERVIKSTSPCWLISTLSHTFHWHTDVISAAAVHGNKEFDLNLHACTSFFWVLWTIQRHTSYWQYKISCKVWQALYECMTSRKHDWKSDVVSPAKAGHNKTTKTSVSLKQYTDVVDHVSSTNTFMSFTWLFYCLICGTVNLFSGLSQTLGLRNWQQHGLFLSVSYFSHIKVCLALFWS